MRPEARLDSALFQLTPTRTRCDLIIIANGKTEKIASGLLNPFLAHLKTAQEQIAKGGYSIRLEPDPERGSAWFTKGTVERFVRFVSTPEVLERVTTIESEISQIENAIAIQSNSSPGLNAAEQSQMKQSATNDGDTESEKAIVLYKPGSQPQLPDTNGSTIEEENSKVKLLKVLETRKTVLQKEQGMAFARAVAAGFDMDSLVDLISFADTFSASRLMEACVKFMDLWKKKHETGQWLEVEAAEISSRSEFSCLNTSGIILTADMMTQKEHAETWHASNGDGGAETNGNADKQNPSDPKMPMGPQEYLQGQYQHPMYSQWPMHSGPPGFQPYAVQGMPHYMNYPGGMPYFPPPYPPREDRRYSASHKTRTKRHSMDNTNADSETWEKSTRSQDDSDENLSDYEKESSRGSESHRKSDRSGRKKSGVVVIRNLNYITSRKHGGSGSESDSATSSEPEEETGDLQPSSEKRRHKNSKKSSTKEGIHKKHTEDSDAYSKDDVPYGLEADSGNWQAFQNFLLTAEDKARTAAEDMFSGEKAASTKKKKNKAEADPIVLPGRDFHDDNGQRMVGLDSVDGQARRLKQIASNDDLMIPSGGTGLTDIRLKEIEGGGGGYKRMSTDEFMIYGQEKHMNNNKSFSDPLVNQEYQPAGKADRGSSNIVTDESFLLPHRSGFQDNLAADNRRAIDIDSELPLVLQTTQNSSKNKVQVNYEPHDLSFVPERETENIYGNYDPALDYDFQLPVENARKLEDHHQEEDASTSTKEEPKKLEKKNLRASQDSLEKRKRDAMMKKITSSRLNPPADAQKRAEKLRAFKADMQKLKKEQEEENIKRLEALKLERQKRIAARSGSNSTQSSPLQKLPTKASRLNGSAHEVTRSASSLSVARKENNGLVPEAKGAHVGSKRLSVP